MATNAFAPTRPSGAATQPDMTLVGELYEEIERHPPAIEARKLIVEQFLAAEWDVRDAVQELYSLANYDPQVSQWHEAFCLKQDAPPAYQPAPSYQAATSASNVGGSKLKANANLKTKKTRFSLTPVKSPISPLAAVRLTATTASGSKRPPAQSVEAVTLPTDPTELLQEKANLLSGYRTFRNKANSLLRDLKLLNNLQSRAGLSQPDSIRQLELENLADGKISTVLSSHEPAVRVEATKKKSPDSARAVANRMRDSPDNAFTIAMADLEDMVPWLKSIWDKPVAPDEDALRELLLKRVRLMVTALPTELEHHAHTAFMHMEHEYFKRRYVNTETMYGDPVADVVRENFLATEDNYAWDMEELAAAIQANKGIMRNPLSKSMFTPSDVKMILQHKEGKALAALEVAQYQMKQGVRPKTVEEMDRMAAILLRDMDDSAKESREALDEFLAYVATLPSKEQDALDNLRVPAKDSHTGQAFDGSIGDTIRDAKSNKLCFHKAGDFIQQAARFLRR